MHTRVLSLLLFLAFHAHAASPGGSLSLSDALALSLRPHTELNAYNWGHRAAAVM